MGLDANSERTISEIAKILGLSRRETEKVHKSAIKKLNKLLKEIHNEQDT